MDFSFSEDQDQIAALTRRIVSDRVTPDTLRAAEDAPDRFDRRLWKALADAGLLGISLPEAVGGGGCGIIEQCLVLEELGRRVAPVPALASIVLGAGPIAEFGSLDHQETWARPAAAGTTILTAALAESANPDPSRPRTTAVLGEDGFVLDGVKTAVPAAPLADLVLVPATVDGMVAVFLVETAAPGVSIERQRTTSRDSAGLLVLEGVEVSESAVLGSLRAGAGIVAWMVERATLGLCALQLGVLEQVLADTASYTTARVQFGRPIATFQAVGHRCADSYIDVEAVRLTLWQAAWRLSAGEDATMEVGVAKFWAAEAGHRVAHAAVHLHGGMGVANEHTTHRYFIAAKQNEFMLGGATAQLLRIGDALAAG